MQDYSFVHYSVFNSVFDCNKTILGDINQCIEKTMNKADLNILCKMLNAEYIELNKAYRSTFEITNFANKLKDINCKKVSRHGEKPKVIECKNISEKIEEIIELNKNYKKIAILTKNQKEAKEIYINLSKNPDISLNIDAEEEVFKICVMPSYLAKGLEFDAVIALSPQNPSSSLGKAISYVSATRALHELIVF